MNGATDSIKCALSRVSFHLSEMTVKTNSRIGRILLDLGCRQIIRIYRKFFFLIVQRSGYSDSSRDRTVCFDSSSHRVRLITVSFGKTRREKKKIPEPNEI